MKTIHINGSAAMVTSHMVQQIVRPVRTIVTVRVDTVRPLRRALPAIQPSIRSASN